MSATTRHRFALALAMLICSTWSWKIVWAACNQDCKMIAAYCILQMNKTCSDNNDMCAAYDDEETSCAQCIGAQNFCKDGDNTMKCVPTDNMISYSYYTGCTALCINVFPALSEATVGNFQVAGGMILQKECVPK